MREKRSTQPLQAFWFGITLPFQAARTIATHPRLLAWSIVPTLITLVLYIIAISHLQTWIETGVSSWFSGWLDPTGKIARGMYVLTEVLLVLLGAVTFSLAANLVSTPFNDFLAEAAERYTRPPLKPVPSVKFSYRLRLIAKDVAKTIFAMGIFLLALICSWVPLLNLASLVVTCLLTTFQFVSYPQTRRGMGIRQGLAFLFRHFPSCLGFGAALTLLLSIPLVSGFFIPIAVVGGTLLFGRHCHAGALG